MAGLDVKEAAPRQCRPFGSRFRVVGRSPALYARVLSWTIEGSHQFNAMDAPISG